MSQTISNSEKSFGAITGKKLIEYGWDFPSVQYVSDNIHEMEKLPFEGVIFTLYGNSVYEAGGSVFQVNESSKIFTPQMEDALRNIKKEKRKFTDNFLAMYARSNMDWTSDEDWKKVTAHASEYAKAAKLSGCVGLLFDPEPYGFSPWNYAQQKNPNKLTYNEYSQVVHQRGKQFMRALTQEFPDVKLLMFFQYSLFYGISHNPDTTVREAELQNDKRYKWSLMLPFLNGMLEESSGNVQLIDGNEPSYYYTTDTEFYRAYWATRSASKINVPNSLKEKYNDHVKAANAIYVDVIFDLRSAKYLPAAGLTDEDRARWFEHNVYYALKTSDEYAWLYSERIDWWKYEPRPAWVEHDLPPGIEQAIVSAKEKLQSGKDLGYTMQAALAQASKNLTQNPALQEKMRRQTVIPRLDSKDIPVIDGQLNESLYEKISWLDYFVTSPLIPESLTAQTQAHLAYDDKNLYIAFRCEEPEMAHQKITNTPEGGEHVEFYILKPGQNESDPKAIYYRFILNPANVQWDSIEDGKKTPMGHHLNWKSATSQNKDGWTAEIEIPWAEIGFDKVQKGMILHGNVARFRVTTTKSEQSSWSQFILDSHEPQNFGDWTLD